MAGFFGLFDYTKPGKGISKDEPKKKGIALYFDIFLRRFWKFIPLNLMYIIASVPAIVIGWFISTYLITWAATQAGISIEETASTLTLISFFATVVFLHICGSGPATAALTYMLRKYVNDTHVWLWSDFIKSFRDNFRQGIVSYFINTVAFFLLILAFLFYTYAEKAPMFSVLRIVIVVVAALFYMMQMYVYQMMSGFELKLKYIYKNAWLLTVLSLPKSILATIINAGIMYVVFSVAMEIPLAGFLMIGLIIYPLLSFNQIFLTNNTVKKYVLEPSMNLDADESEKEEIDPDFEDA